MDNKTLIIPKNAVAGIEIKNSDGSKLRGYPANDKLVIIDEEYNLQSLEKVSSSLSISSTEYGLAGMNSVDGSYYAVNLYIVMLNQTGQWSGY